jgi:hypothetical protein
VLCLQLVRLLRGRGERTGRQAQLEPIGQTQFVLFDMQIRKLEPNSATVTRILVPSNGRAPMFQGILLRQHIKGALGARHLVQELQEDR